MPNEKGGRPRKPRGLAVIDGDPTSRINTHEPSPEQADVAPPGYLSPHARAVWERLAPGLVAARVLTPWDADTFASYCDAVARHERAAAQLDAMGEVIEGYRGSEVKNPWFQIWRDTTDVMTRLGGRFGLNPSDRGGLSIEEEGKPGGAERFLS
ncbi:phage terminase small subunit P27 family [Nocardiopsis rhodophaea]|uniref:phage terminase small subunit P27 family n=1 Tax=Nocardiopsis rhodophaea TaxID=280238 RepID=UPI0031DF2BDC